MNIESTKFFKINKIVKTFIIIVLACCILINIVDAIRLHSVINLKFTFRVIITLSIFIISLYYENYFTTIVLLVFNILFWEITINERENLSWYDNAFNHYDNVFLGKNIGYPLFIIFKTAIVSPLSLLSNLLIWTIIIPFRIKKFYLKKN
ncbi:hypothetical protein AB4Y90_08510 [Chryseobacterium sp. 2TAF14]|uniref:hypothetical protein n=1 Tax=Chryseobacterium sp. 2TAF14 TaxID=3233007 RepID=UPI003F918D82